QHRRPAGSVLPALRQPPLPGDRSGRAPAGPHPPGRHRPHRAVRAAPRRVRPRCHVRAGHASRRRRGPLGGQVLARPARVAHAFHSRVHRSRVHRPRHARAVEHGHHADQAVAGNEDRPALLLPALLLGRAAVRLRGDGLALPRPARSNGVPRPPGLLPRTGVVNRPEPPAGPTTLLDAGLADPHHLLVLGPDVTPDEVEALAVSRSDTAGWAGHADIRLLPGVHLTGPWGIDPTLRATFDLPSWADHAYLVQCPVVRTHPLPPALAGVDPILDAFPDGVPTGVEQEALDHLRAIARRLGGALRIAGSGAVVTLDPESATDLTVHAPIWLDPDACVSVLRPALPDPRNLLDEIPPDAAGDEPIEVYGVAS